MSEAKKFLLMVLPFLCLPGVYYLKLHTGNDVSLFYGTIFWAGVVVLAVIIGVGNRREEKLRLTAGRKLNIVLHLAANAVFWTMIVVGSLKFNVILGPSIAGRVLFLLALVAAAAYTIHWGAAWLRVALGRPPSWLDVTPVLSGGVDDGDLGPSSSF